ncbi:MAG: hypothetical protein K9M99_13470, partial [Candidatus Cloacimonetes bacterium]|nr:hypothetical protein [Candidatus Cloacimonadota bacterium]
MRNYVIVLMLLIFTIFTYCDELIVDIEGNYEYTSIQAAVTAAEDGDEIIVHPGTYYENVDLMGKQLELKSLFAVTGERHYISETIINGNETGSCIYSLDGGDVSLIIIGFTLTGGSGTEYLTTGIYYGGGLYLQDNDAELFSCIIENNIKLDCGGGIALCHESNLEISDTIIRNNTASWFGGGIFFFNGVNNIIFDSDNRCSIYNNYSTQGADIYSRYEGGNQTVYLDTVTVADYEGYYILQTLETPPGFSMEGLTIDYENVWLESVDADLYVSPEGDDANSGSSWDDPLKSITWAIQKIKVNPDDPHTIFLEDGIYSEALTGEIMPFQVKDCTSIVGQSDETTIIEGDLNEDTSFFVMRYGDNSFCISNLRFRNSNARLYPRPAFMNSITTRETYLGECEFHNIILENNDNPHCVMSLQALGDVVMDNVQFINNGFDNPPTVLKIELYDDSVQHTVYLNNIVSINNNTGKIIIIGFPYIRSDAYISNFVSSDNYCYNDGSTGFQNYYSLLGLGDGINCYLINSTLANNTADMDVPVSAAVQTGYYCNLNVINSIIYNNEVDYAINSLNTFTGYEVNVHHSLIENGDNGINSILPYSYDLETNLDCDPIFSGDEDHPLSLHEYSPCIDAGTTVMPEGFTLPETDAAGNPRIMGSGIDMGAYEYNPFGNPVTETELVTSKLQYYPNPVRINEGRGAV